MKFRIVEQMNGHCIVQKKESWLGRWKYCDTFLTFDEAYNNIKERISNHKKWIKIMEGEKVKNIYVVDDENMGGDRCLNG